MGPGGFRGLVLSSVSSIAGEGELIGHAIVGVWRGDLQVWGLTGNWAYAA